MRIFESCATLYQKPQKNMKRIFTTFFLIFSVTIFSQELKTFEGNYKEGTAKYSFYEGKNDEIILNGKFEYFKSNNQSEIGQYSQNLKAGTWKYNFENEDYKIDFYGNYINDLKNGIWTFNFKENGVSETYSLDFKNDTLIGKINWNGLKGEFDERGRFIGNWEVNYNFDRDKYIAIFKDNILIRLENRGIITSRTYLDVYQANTNSIDFTKLSLSENSIIRKEYDLDWNFRLMSKEFDVDKIYYINNLKIDGVSPAYLKKEQFFQNFYDAITDRINEKISDYTNWTFFKPIELKNNPEFLYSNIQTVIPKQQATQDYFNFDNFIDNRLVDEKPLFKEGNNNFIPFIKDNYFNFDEVSGRAIIEFIIDKKGNINVLKVTTTGNFSEREIRRVLSRSPKWKPGKKEGKPVDVKIILPINVMRN